MNETVAEFTRSKLKKGLKKLNQAQIAVFKKMYSHNDLDKDIEDVVDDMPDEKLDWALTQVQNTIKDD